jgi:hypothetical protein
MKTRMIKIITIIIITIIIAIIMFFPWHKSP